MAKRRRASSFQRELGLEGVVIRLLSKSGKLARNKKHVVSFEVIGPRGGKILSEKLPPDFREYPWDYILGRVQFALTYRKQRAWIKKIQALQYRIEDSDYLLRRGIKNEAKRKKLEATRRLALEKLNDHVRTTLNEFREAAKVRRTPDKLSLLEQKRVSFLLRTYRHLPIELRQDRQLAEILIDAYTDQMMGEMMRLYLEDPEKNNIFDYGLLAVIDNELERVLPGFRLRVLDPTMIELEKKRYKAKILREFFDRGPTPTSARRATTTAYFLGKYQNSIVDIAGYALDSVIPPRNAKLSLDEKKRLARWRPAKRRKEKVRTKKRDAERTRVFESRKKGRKKKKKRAPGRKRKLKTERNPRGVAK